MKHDMSNSKKYCCSNCGYSAKNSTVFYDEEGHSESISCPKCGSENIVPDRRYRFRIGWELIHDSGVTDEIDKLDDVTLRLAEISDSLEQGNMSENEVPKNVLQEINERQKQVNDIFRNSGIVEKLKKIGVNVRTNITVFRSS